MSLVENYQPPFRNSDAAYAQHCCGNRCELPPSDVNPSSSVESSHLQDYLQSHLRDCNPFGCYGPEPTQDFRSPTQAEDYSCVDGNASRPRKCFKRRVTSNRKERRRTLSINNAMAELRECIPNVPSDTKLSKIKTLRLASSYIAYLMDLLAQEDPERAPQGGFKAELCKQFESWDERRKREIASLNPGTNAYRKSKGRTGWPQHVWAHELKSDT